MLHETTRIGVQGSGELDVLSTLDIEDNGLVLQGIMEDGILKARPSNATADTHFLGFSWGIVGRGVPTTIPKAEILHTSANNGGFATVPLGAVLSASGILAVYTGTGYGSTGATKLTKTASATTAPADATQFQLGADSRTITVTSANADKDLFVVYRTSPTVESARWIYGDMIPGNRAPQNFGRIGTIYNGVIVTDMFDPDVDWSVVGDKATGHLLKGGANGLVTINGNGCLIDGKVTRVPTPDLPFLSIALSDATVA